MAFKNLDPVTMEPNIPCYCFDTKCFSDNVNRYKQMLDGEIDLIFSIKANPFLAQTALKCADGIEVCSSGEIAIAKKCLGDLPLAKGCESKIIFGGICKEQNDWRFAITTGIRKFSVESLSQLNTLEKVASEFSVSVKALVRISSGNQFGVDIDEAKECFINSKRFSYTKVSGIHYYPGTMRMTLRDVETDFNKFNNSLQYLNGCCIDEIEYGAGIGTDYYGNCSMEDIIEFITKKMNLLAKNHKVSYETGRCLAADAGVYIARVVETKQIQGKNYLVLNGGRHHFTYHGGITKLGKHIPCLTVIQQNPVASMKKTTIVGALCTSSDILANEVDILTANTGDYIIFQKAGAYCATEGTALFLNRDIPAIILIQENGEFLIKRAKTFNIGL